MKREIKFRAWDVTNKKMIEAGWWGVQANSGRLFENETNYLPFDGKEIPLQYTGLHDKNGKEIFEGDVVKISRPTGELIKEVFWKSDANGTGFRPRRLYKSECVEIIGNIYQNPELIK